MDKQKQFEEELMALQKKFGLGLYAANIVSPVNGEVVPAIKLVDFNTGKSVDNKDSIEGEFTEKNV